jgi:ABC-type multidrug transport system fused ATPase/permease subunit
MNFNQNLSNDLRIIIDKVEDLLDRISIDERRIEKIDKHEWAIAYAGILLRIIVGILYLIIGLFVAVIIDKSWWINLIGVFVVLCFVEAIITGPIFKNRSEKRIKRYEKDLSLLEREFYHLVDDKLLPEIHSLGMMTVKNIINKTSARYLPVECVKDFMDKEVERGNFEKVRLNDDDVLYKSKNPKFLSNIKSVTLEID